MVPEQISGQIQIHPTHVPQDERDQRFMDFLSKEIQRYTPSDTFLQDFSFGFSGTKFTMEVRPKLPEIQLLRSLVFWVLGEEFKAPETVASDFILAFEEALSNVVRHSYGPEETDHWAKVYLAREGDTVHMQISDRGEAGRTSHLSDVLETISKTGRPPIKRRGGLGLYLMRRIMTDISYTPGDENCLRMYKELETNS